MRPAIKGLLLRRVIVSLVAGVILAGIETERRVGSVPFGFLFSRPLFRPFTAGVFGARVKLRFTRSGLWRSDRFRSSDRTIHSPEK